MKRALKGLSYLLIAAMIISFSIPWGIPAAAAMNGPSSQKSLTVLFTSDLHDHLLSANVKIGDTSKELGGYARLSSAIKQERGKDKNLLLLDGGDFSMGTLFQSIYSANAPGLRMLGLMGYDATTLGNHEFDFRAEGLAESLNAAKRSGEKLPQIIASNLRFPVKEIGEMTESLSDLQKAMGDYGVKEYTILQRNGIKIGIFGGMGEESISNAPMAEVSFVNEIEVAKELVKKLRDAEKVDIVICLSHAGTNKDKSRSEDEKLAKEVPGIDIIISGHSHTKLEQPIKVGNTVICSSGEYGENLGILKVSKSDGEAWTLDQYSLKQIDSSIAEDPVVAEKIKAYKQVVQNNYLGKFGLEFDQILAQSTFDFKAQPEIEKYHQEDTLGNLISDAYIHAVKKAEGSSYDPVAMAIVPIGTIRASFVKGNITVSDAFNVSSLGIGADKLSGYPLISVYLTGKELKTACEVDASIAPLMSGAQLYMSGLSYTFNPKRFLFNKITRVDLLNEDGTYGKIDDKKLYRVVAGLYSAQMLSAVGAKSYGLLSLVPKTKDGQPITDFETQIIKDTASGRNNEMKEWLAIAEYLKSFDKVNGIPQIPEYYKTTHNRKVVDSNGSIFAILSQPNAIILGVYAIILVLLSLIVLAVYLLATRKRRKAKRMAERLNQNR